MVTLSIDDLTPAEALVLDRIGDPSDCKCLNFNHLAEQTGLSRDEAATAARSLRERGIAECYTGLWTDDGEPYGSGYGFSAAYLASVRGEQ